MKGSVLVTGGAGYIGSHVVHQLGERQENVVVLDNLSTGFRDAVLHGELVIGDSGDEDTVMAVLVEHNIKSVLHFAAHTVVPESVADPLKYYGNNTASTLNLLRCCNKAGVKQLIFSSTAAVYGDVQGGPVNEDAPPNPINPYGLSKLMSEWMLRDLAKASALRYVALRYFNVAGADPLTRIGQSTPQATHLIKAVCEALVGKRPTISVYGSDYQTPDGTGVRDYIHVDDLAAAHLRALDYLRAGGTSQTLNCGYGRGYSVQEVIECAQSVADKKLDVIYAPRRPGDSASVVADARRIGAILGWQPEHDDLAFIIETALAWERLHR